MTNIAGFKTLNEVEAYRKQINEACDKRSQIIKKCMKASELGNKRFLELKETFENMSPILFESEEGKRIIGKYIQTMKNTSNLKNLLSLYENIRKASNLVDTDYFVKNITECDWNIDKKTLNEDIKKLGRIISEGYLLIGDKADSCISNVKQDLLNAADYIAENKKTNKNIAEYSEAVKIIKECIESQEDYHILKESSMDSIATKLIENFNEKYSDSLTDQEKVLVREIAENSKENVFSKYKDICIEKINEAKNSNEDIETKDRLTTIAEQVSSKKFSQETFGDDIISLFEMINVFNK